MYMNTAPPVLRHAGKTAHRHSSGHLGANMVAAVQRCATHLLARPGLPVSCTQTTRPNAHLFCACGQAGVAAALAGPRAVPRTGGTWAGVAGGRAAVSPAGKQAATGPATRRRRLGAAVRGPRRPTRTGTGDRTRARRAWPWAVRLGLQWGYTGVAENGAGVAAGGTESPATHSTTRVRCQPGIEGRVWRNQKRVPKTCTMCKWNEE